jgi:ADP-heptose:LPS heptosyltransferase
MKRWAAVARFGGVGDNLVAGSVFAPLKRLGYMTEVITSPPNHVVYLHNPYIDKMSVKIVERDLPQGDLDQWQNWIESRAKEYDVFVHASHSMEGRHAFFSSMTSFWWPQDYRRKIAAGSYLETVHDIAGVPYEFGPLFFTSDDEKKNAKQIKNQIGGDKLVAWVLSGTRIDKVYISAPQAIARIIKECGARVCLIGSASEKEFSMAETIKQLVEDQNGTREGLHSVVVSPSAPEEQRTNVRPALAFLQECDLVVTPDTGPGWAVAMDPMPKVAMVSHASAENITKHWVNTITLHADPIRVPCWPCHRLHNGPETCVRNKEGNGAACISDISVETVVQSVRAGLANGHRVIHAEHAFSLARRQERGGMAARD